MNPPFVLGLFALSVAVISLYRVLRGQEDALLSLLRRFWGRVLGHALYFVANVALPLLICVLCLGMGVRQYDSSLTVHHPSLEQSLRLNIESYRNLRQLLEAGERMDPVVVLYGA